MRIPRTWPSAVFIIIPVFIITVDAVVLVRERLQSNAQKAIRLVKESNSRKENFTVQQFLTRDDPFVQHLYGVACGGDPDARTLKNAGRLGRRVAGPCQTLGELPQDHSSFIIQRS